MPPALHPDTALRSSPSPVPSRPHTLLTLSSPQAALLPQHQGLGVMHRRNYASAGPRSSGFTACGSFEEVGSLGKSSWVKAQNLGASAAPPLSLGVLSQMHSHPASFLQRGEGVISFWGAESFPGCDSSTKCLPLPDFLPVPPCSTHQAHGRGSLAGLLLCDTAPYSPPPPLPCRVCVWGGWGG